MHNAHDVINFIESVGNEKERRVFCFEKDALIEYLKWASVFNYLFVDLDKNGISGLGVAFPIKEPFNGTKEWFFSFNSIPSKDIEQNCDICIMEFVALNKKARTNIINIFKNRYPNWELQKKYALIRGNIKEIPNKYLNLLN